MAQCMRARYVSLVRVYPYMFVCVCVCVCVHMCMCVFVFVYIYIYIYIYIYTYIYTCIDTFADGSSLYEGQVCVASTCVCMYIQVCVCV